MNRAILASTVIGAIAVMMITSTLPAYSNHGPDHPQCEGVPATVWYDDDAPGSNNGWAIDYTGETVPVKFKPNKNTGGFKITGDLADDNDDVIIGSPYDDIISAGKGTNRVCGGDGDDTISGGRGMDTIFGEDGADTIRGGSGDDELYANTSSENSDGEADYVDGGRGNDTIYAEIGEDTWNGGRGNDTCPNGEDVQVSCES